VEDSRPPGRSKRTWRKVDLNMQFRSFSWPKKKYFHDGSVNKRHRPKTRIALNLLTAILTGVKPCTETNDDYSPVVSMKVDRLVTQNHPLSSAFNSS